MTITRITWTKDLKTMLLLWINLIICHMTQTQMIHHMILAKLLRIFSYGIIVPICSGLHRPRSNFVQMGCVAFQRLWFEQVESSDIVIVGVGFVRFQSMFYQLLPFILNGKLFTVPTLVIQRFAIRCLLVPEHLSADRFPTKTWRKPSSRMQIASPFWRSQGVSSTSSSSWTLFCPLKMRSSSRWMCHLACHAELHSLFQVLLPQTCSCESSSHWQSHHVCMLLFWSRFQQWIGLEKCFVTCNLVTCNLVTYYPSK